MKLGPRSIKKLALLITGDNPLARYRSGSMLVKLFNNYEFDHEYGRGFPTRRVYVEDNLREMNERPELKSLIEEVFDTLEFRETDLDTQAAIDDINPFLQRDGFQIAIVGDRARVQATNKTNVQTIDRATVEYSVAPNIHPIHSMDFIVEQIDKCKTKLADRDYSGAITNARSLCEQVLMDIEKRLCDNPPNPDGNLPKLGKRVRHLLNMATDEQENAIQIISGLTSTVNGIAGISNNMGDRHAGGIQPKKHHAILAVNAANTLCTFLSASFHHQNNKDNPPQS